MLSPDPVGNPKSTVYIGPTTKVHMQPPVYSVSTKNFEALLLLALLLL